MGVQGGELPVKQGINNVLQGRDEQTHQSAFAVTEDNDYITLSENY